MCGIRYVCPIHASAIHLFTKPSVDRKHGDSLRINVLDDSHVRYRLASGWASTCTDGLHFRIAIWERKWVIIAPLLALCLAHWALLYHGIIIVKAAWDPTQGACVVFATNHTFLTVNFFYSACIYYVLCSATVLTSFYLFLCPFRCIDYS